MFDDRQTKEEIIAAASIQNQRLVEALCDVQRRDAEIERLRAENQTFRQALQNIGYSPWDRETMRSTARIELAYSNEQRVTEEKK